MKVYVVEHGADFEGSNIIVISDTLKKALNAALKFMQETSMPWQINEQNKEAYLREWECGSTYITITAYDLV